MIDFDLEIKNIQPINMNNMELNIYKVNDNIRKAITLYNKAIAEIRINNLDLAIKDLKKSLYYNSGFAEAMKLLGLCYVNGKEYRRAEKTFKKMVKYDIYTELAKEYIKALLIEKNVSKTMMAIRKVKDSSNNENKKHNIPKHLLTRKIIIGCTILTIFSIVFIAIYRNPSITQTCSKEIGVIYNKIVNSKEKTHENSEQNKTSSAISVEEYKNIQSKLDNTKFELDNYKNKYNILLMLDEVEKLYNDRNYEESASMLLYIKDMNFDDETKIKFDKLWLSVKTDGLWTIYNDGSRLYKVGKYQEALPKLIMVSKIDPNLSIMPWITFQIGMCYKETNDNANALVFFQKVKDDYPKCQYVSSSERMISKIGNK